MRKQRRSAAVITTVLLTVGAPLAVSGVLGAATAHADEDRTNSPEYTAARADYWDARAAYEATKAANAARRGDSAPASADAAPPDAGPAPAPAPDDQPAPLMSSRAAARAATVAPSATPLPAPSDTDPVPVAAVVASSDGGGPTAAQWAAVRRCESGDNYGINTGNGYYGAYQFSPITWWWLGYQGYPNQAAPWVQDQAARDLWAIYGWSPWPACSRSLGFL